MSAVLLPSIAILLAAIPGSLTLLVRTGESRVALLTALFAALAVQQGALFLMQGDAALGLDLASAVGAAGLAASVLGLLHLIALWRTLGELERAENLHWDSMEGVRALTELAARRHVGFDDKLATLLEMGCQRLDLEIGVVTRIVDDRYEVVAIHAPEDLPVANGDHYRLEDTYCATTIASERPLAIANAGGSHWADHPARASFPFESYLGAALRVRDEVVGTLFFASLKPRKSRYTASHKDLLLLMAQWIGSDLERQEIAQALEQKAVAPRWAMSAPRRQPFAPGLDLNSAVRRLERRIGRLVKTEVELVTRLAEDLEPAPELRLPIDAIVMSLARTAAERMPSGGTLTLTTANLEVERAEPGTSAVMTDRYVTLAVADTGGGLDADALARAFESHDGELASDPAAALEGRLQLASLRRMLERCGVDLSVEVDPACGSTFTVFLPVRKEKVRDTTPPRAARAAAAPRSKVGAVAKDAPTPQPPVSH